MIKSYPNLNNIINFGHQKRFKTNLKQNCNLPQIFRFFRFSLFRFSIQGWSNFIPYLKKNIFEIFEFSRFYFVYNFFSMADNKFKPLYFDADYLKI